MMQLYLGQLNNYCKIAVKIRLACYSRKKLQPMWSCSYVFRLSCKIVLSVDATVLVCTAELQFVNCQLNEYWLIDWLWDPVDSHDSTGPLSWNQAVGWKARNRTVLIAVFQLACIRTDLKTNHIESGWDSETLASWRLEEYWKIF
jgi:hypothetical protein